MKESIRTAKLKLKGDNSNLLKVTTSYKDAANWLSEIIHNRKKIETPAKLSREFYGTVREKFQLPSQVTCSLFRHVVGTYRTAKSNKRWKLAKFNKLNVPICWKRDFNVSKTKGLTIWSQPFEYKHGPIPEGKWSDSKIKKIKKNWYLILSVKVQIPESKAEGTILGVDAGIKNLMTCIDPKTNKTLYVKGGALNHKRERIRRTRAKVASVGTRSSKRLLRRLSGKEAAVTQQLCHLASKQVVAFAQSVNARSLCVEDLGSVRNSSNKKGKTLRSSANRWPFGKCQFFLQYKAEGVGITFEKVDPRYTSQACAVCGHTVKSNRNGLSFRCKSCDYQDNADRNGAKNIALRSVLQRQASGERVMNQLAYSDESSHDGLVTNLGACPRGS